MNQITQVSSFFTGSEPREIVFEVAKLSDADRKVISRATLNFNQTLRESDLHGSYKITPVRPLLADNLINLNPTTWFRLALFVGTVALTIFGGYHFIRYFMEAHNDACLKVATGQWGLYSQGGLVYEGPAKVWDFLKVVAGVGVAGALTASNLTVASWIYLNCSLTKFDRVTLSIRHLMRELPEPLNNTMDELQFKDPLTNKWHPLSYAACPAFIYLDGYIVEAEACVRARESLHLAKNLRVLLGCEALEDVASISPPNNLSAAS